MTIVYAEEPNLPVDDYVAVLAETTMGGKRPLFNRDRIGRMLAGASLIVTARDNGTIVGLARCISDGAWVAYCAELAVRESAQKHGVGAGLIAKARELLGPGMGLVLISEIDAIGFYERIGMERLDRAFFHNRSDST